MAAITKEGLEVLVHLQEQDTALDKLRASLDDVPKAVAAQKAALEAEKKKLAQAHEKIQKLAVSRKEKELEVADKEAAIRKHQNELNAVKSNEAFKALLHEIEMAKEAKSRIEDDILGLMEQGETLAAEEKQEKVAAGKLEQEAGARIKELEGRQAELEAKVAAAQQERDQTAARVPADALAKYDSIRKRRGGLAVVPAKKNFCGGCNMQLTPQAQVDVHKKEAGLVICDNCQRILYLPPA